MAKSKILLQLVNNEITLDVALKRLMLICSDLHYDEIYKWAEKELEGYGNDDEIPEYRNLGVGQIFYSGLKGNSFNMITLTNQPFPIHWVPKEVEEYVFKNYEKAPIRSIVEKANSNSTFSQDLTTIVPLVKVGIGFTSITQRFDSFHYGEVSNRISNVLFKIFKELDSEYGNLDELDIDISNKNNVEIINIEKVLLSYVGELKCIQIGDNNEIKDSNIGESNEN